MLNWLERTSFLPPPDTHLGVVLHALWDYSPHILLAGLIFSVTGIPAFSLFLLGAFLPALLLAAATLAPAWVALLSTALEFLGPQPLSLRQTIVHMARTWCRLWPVGLILGLALVFPIAAFLTTLPLLSVPEAPNLVWIGLVADVWLLAVLAALSFYAIPMRIKEDAGWVVSIRDAANLASRNIGHTIGLIGLSFVIIMSFAFLSSGLWFVLPGIWALFVAGNYHLITTNRPNL